MSIARAIRCGGLLMVFGCSSSSPTGSSDTGASSTHGGMGTVAAGGMASSTSAQSTTTAHDDASSASVATGSGGATTSTTSTSASGGAVAVTTSAGTGGGEGIDVLQALRDYLAIERETRPELATQPFASVPVTAADAEVARALFWEDHALFVSATRQDEASDRSIALDGQTLVYDFTVFGEAPAGGRSLFLSLHGGGEADASVNDQQWENQKTLYQPDEGIYLAPRAPTNTWNLWHEAHIDVLFDRLVTNMIVFEGVDPNRVYVMGYSAGGDGVYQLGPRMADYWAAAAMMAGHPNDAKPDSLRNIGYTIHVGGQDTAFDRNLVAEEWGVLLDQLEADDPGGYPHYVEVHPDKPHWMDLEDAVAVPWMAEFTRDPLPDRVVWLQDDITHERFYWLAVDAADAAGGNLIVANRDGQTIELEADGVSRVLVRLNDDMLDLDQPISIVSGGSTLFEGMVERSLVTLQATTEERGDPALVFSVEVAVDMP